MALLNPYLNFRDNAREAMEFYKSVFGGKLVMDPFSFMGETGDPVEDNKVMHAVLETDNGMTFMASDTPQGMEYQEGSRVSISLSGTDEAELRSYWEKLSEGGKITMPLEKAQWGDLFGMLTDKFGIKWMVNVGSAT